jgi:hypothetical protein
MVNAATSICEQCVIHRGSFSFAEEMLTSQITAVLVQPKLCSDQRIIYLWVDNFTFFAERLFDDINVCFCA